MTTTIQTPSEAQTQISISGTKLSFGTESETCPSRWRCVHATVLWAHTIKGGARAIEGRSGVSRRRSKASHSDLESLRIMQSTPAWQCRHVRVFADDAVLISPGLSGIFALKNS
jgi:hypothetical protein